MNREQLDETRDLHKGWRSSITACPREGEPCTQCAKRAAATAERVPALLEEIDRLNTALGACQTALNHHLEACNSDELGSASALRAGDDKSEWPAHLRDDAPSQRCSRCGRLTGAVYEFDGICGMTQPTGQPCGGRFDWPTTAEGAGEAGHSKGVSS